MTNSASKTLYVFSSDRAKLSFYDEIGGEKGAILPHCIGLGELFDKIILVESKTKIPNDMAKILLISVLKDLKDELYKSKYFDENLFENNFLSFLEMRDFTLTFFDELYNHNVDLSNVELADIYGDYEDHFNVIKKIYDKYIQILDMLNMYHKPQKYKILHSFLSKYDNIEIFLDGVFNQVELDKIRSLSAKCNIIIHISVDRFNLELMDFLPQDTYAKLRENHIYKIKIQSNLTKAEILSCSPIKSPTSIESYSFTFRANQVALIFEMIDRWTQEGIHQSDIVVITPDSAFVSYLKLFDTNHILNYASGEDVADMEFYKYIESFMQTIEDDSVNQMDTFIKYMECLLKDKNFENSYLKVHQTIKDAIKELIFKWKQMEEFLAKFSLEELFYLLLEEINGTRINDISGGAIRVLDTLETRGAGFSYEDIEDIKDASSLNTHRFSHVIIVDFNDEFVPKVSENDMFLNAKIRHRLNMPTIQDRQNLQNHYYYNLIKNADNVVISMVLNDESNKANMFFVLQNEFKFQDMRHDAFLLFEPQDMPSFVDDTFMIDAKLDAFSPSGLSTLLQCRRKYYFSYLAGFKTEQDDRQKDGTEIHKILEDSFKDISTNEYINMEDVKAKALNIIDSKKDMADGRKIFDLEICKHNILRYLNDARNQNKKHYETESKFDNVDIEDFMFNGKIDRIYYDDDNIYVIDYKNKKSTSLDGTYRNTYCDFAMEIYKLAIQQADKYKDHRSKHIHMLYYFLLDDKLIEINEQNETNKNKLVLREDTLREKLKSLKEEIEKNANKLEATLCEDINMCKKCHFAILCDRKF